MISDNYWRSRNKMSEFCFERNEWLSFTIKNPDVYLAMINDPVKENALHAIC